MTSDQAKALFETNFWESMTQRERAILQLFEEFLCMPFSVFHEAMEKTLGRPIFTHEFAYPDSLRSELIGESAAPTMEQIIAMIPAEKRIVVGI